MGSVGEEKNFPVLRLRLEKFFPSLDSGEVLRHPQGLGERLVRSPRPPLGRRGLAGRVFSFPIALFSFGTPSRG